MEGGSEIDGAALDRLMAAADERRFWKEVGKMAWTRGRRRVTAYANERARRLADEIVREVGESAGPEDAWGDGEAGGKGGV